MYLYFHDIRSNEILFDINALCAIVTDYIETVEMIT